MSSAELVMDSEKEEAITTTDHLEVQHEEVIPGSSPEGVFSNGESHIFETIDNQEDLAPHQIPLHLEDLKHGEEIVEEHSGVLEQGEQMGEIMVEEGEQQYQDGPYMVQISHEDMYEAGFGMIEDLSQLTTEQLNHVIAISQQRQASHNGQGEVEEEGHHMMHNHGHHGMMGEEYDDGSGANDYAQIQMTNDKFEVAVTDEGGVNLTDIVKQRQFYIPPEELASLNINLNPLSEEDVSQIIQFVLPSLKEDDRHAVLDQTPSTSYHHHQDQMGAEKEVRNPMIGETVQIRTSDGRLQDAVVKYVRGNSEFKIQFMDGEFAYARMDQMLVPHRAREHDNYQVAPPMLLRRTDINRMHGQKRAAVTSGEDLCPPVLKRSYQLAPVVDGPHVVHTPNFCCPICDKKVFQKEPSYIVIRLPACDSCTREKIIVLDEQNS